jgi:hypothetical protein
MRLSFWKSTAVILSGLVVLVMTTAPTALHQARATNTSRASASQAVISQFETFVSELQPYVERASDGTLALAAPRSLTIKLNQRWLAQAQQNMSKLNDRVRQGVLTTTPGLAYVSRTQIAPVYVIQDGWTGVNCYWWGCEIHISNWVLSNYVFPIWNLGGAAVAIRLARFGIAGWEVAALFLIGYAATWACDAVGGFNGIIVWITTWVNPPVDTCTPQ